MPKETKEKPRKMKVTHSRKNETVVTKKNTTRDIQPTGTDHGTVYSPLNNG